MRMETSSFTNYVEKPKTFALIALWLFAFVFVGFLWTKANSSMKNGVNTTTVFWFATILICLAIIFLIMKWLVKEHGFRKLIVTKDKFIFREKGKKLEFLLNEIEYIATLNLKPRSKLSLATLVKKPIEDALVTNANLPKRRSIPKGEESKLFIFEDTNAMKKFLALPGEKQWYFFSNEPHETSILLQPKESSHCYIFQPKDTYQCARSFEIYGIEKHSILFDGDRLIEQ